MLQKGQQLMQLRLKGVGDSDVFNPSRLRVARKRRGLTKLELAERIGVEWRSVSGYEAGEYPPSEDTLARIGVALKFPVAFFCGDDLEEPDPDIASFRAMKKMTAAQRDMALGEGALALLLNKFIEGKFVLPQADLPDLSHEDNPEAAAQSLRRYWGKGELPIPNMIHLLESKGVRIFSLAIDAVEVDAFSMWKGKTPFIFLNSHKSSEHSRFDAAHELGHLVMHRHASPNGREAEKEANAFASAFLMPRGSVLANAPRTPTLPVLIKLKKIWTVSVAALNYRLHNLGLTSDWQYRGLCVQLAKYGRDWEPEEAQRETSQALAKVFAALHEDGMNRTQVAKTLSIFMSELDQLLFGLVMTSIEGGRSGEPERRSRANLTVVKQ
jgi:Zn-dependent peptidase ImmA (M78 family)/DNA-binding XRE family transcriptional regulator